MLRPDDIRARLRQHAIVAWLISLVLIIAAAGGCWAFFSDQTPGPTLWATIKGLAALLSPMEWVALTVMILAFCGVAFISWAVWTPRHSARKQWNEGPSRETAVADPLASSEAVARLRTIYRTYWNNAFSFTYNYVGQVILEPAEASEALSDRLIASLVRADALVKLGGAHSAVEAALATDKDLTTRQFREAYEKFEHAVEAYSHLWWRALQAATVFFGEDRLPNLQEYGKANNFHSEGVAAIRETTGWKELKSLASRASHLGDLLPDPATLEEASEISSRRQ